MCMMCTHLHHHQCHSQPIVHVCTKLVIRIMDVGKQSNGSDCGVLSIAFAYDVCTGNDPKYNHKSHMLQCLEECRLSRFPLVSEGIPK